MAKLETQVARAAITIPRPVYVFFQGSGGINIREVKAISDVMDRSGWIVIEPDLVSSTMDVQSCELSAKIEIPGR